MAKMPSGQPRSTVDPADEQMAKARAKKKMQEVTPRSLVDKARDTLDDYEFRKPGMAESFIPVIGPAWEAAYDLQEGDYAGAAFNGAMAVADLLPIGVAAKGVRAATKGVSILKKGSVSANAAAKSMRAKGVVPKGYEVHHTIPLNGASRTAQDPRNHYALLKVLPKEQHRRLTGSWQGKPQYDPVRRVWYGTTDWQKAVPTHMATEAADAGENVASRSSPPAASRQRR